MHALEHQVEGLQQGQAGLEQRRQLLVEDHELLGRNAPAPDPAESRQGTAGRQAAASHLEEVNPALTEIAPQGGLVAGGEDLFQHPAVRRSYPTDELHRFLQLSYCPSRNVSTSISAPLLASFLASPRLIV